MVGTFLVNVDLGTHVRDAITGFEGTVISVCKNLHGAMRVCVALHNLEKGKIVEEWFNVGRLSIVENATA